MQRYITCLPVCSIPIHPGLPLGLHCFSLRPPGYLATPHTTEIRGKNEQSCRALILGTCRAGLTQNARGPSDMQISMNVYFCGGILDCAQLKTQYRWAGNCSRLGLALALVSQPASPDTGTPSGLCCQSQRELDPQSGVYTWLCPCVHGQACAHRAGTAQGELQQQLTMNTCCTSHSVDSVWLSGPKDRVFPCQVSKCSWY